MTPLLVVVLALGQSVYEWTDARGELHFTDDPSTIPKGVKVRTTDGEDINVISARRTAADAGVQPKRAGPTSSPRPERATAPPWPELADGIDTSCSRAAAKVRELEERYAATRREADIIDAKLRLDCASLLNTHGHAEYEKCQASPGGRPSRRPTRTIVKPDVGPIERQLEAAREVHRRAQLAGCP
jgi:hypothetical protein